MNSKRKGISPIVAIVLLLMMTIAAAGGTFLWIQNIAKQSQDQTNTALGTKLEIIDLVCDQQGSADRFRVSIQNTGAIKIDTSKINVFIRSVADNSLKDQLINLDWSNYNFKSPGEFDTVPFSTGWLALNGDIFEQNGLVYRFRFNFPNSGYDLEKTCIVADLEN